MNAMSRLAATVGTAAVAALATWTFATAEDPAVQAIPVTATAVAESAIESSPPGNLGCCRNLPSDRSLFVDAPVAAPAAEETEAVKPARDWKKDEVCRMVFFAVLEGLYEDGVTDDVVDNLVPPDLQGEEKMRRSFVVGCPLCQPTFEAFVAYQARPKFSDGSDARAFGDGAMDEKLKAALLKDGVAPRLIALRQPVAEWVERRLRTMDLTEDERIEWQKRIDALAGDGMAKLKVFNKTDPHYADWSGYWGCAACGGSLDGCREASIGK